MMKRAKHTRRTFKLRHLLYLVLVTSVISSTTLARYATKGIVGAEAKIAAFVSNTTFMHELGTLEDLAPGDTEKIYFTVTNKDGSTICDVPIDYEVQIVTTGNLPLNFSLSGKVSDDGVTDESLTKLVELGALDQTKEYRATGGKFPSGRYGAASHTYTLTVSWPQDKTAEAYSDEIDRLAVKIKTVQSAG